MISSGGGSSSDEAASGSKQALKKGPWTAAEDEILIEYVKKHGEGNWNAVQKNSGLSRCGKSCRLRWANHLRPNLRKGSFTPEEERLILELHARIGNKWARMASQLPGRTDNEIKNYWNTRTKRRQRAGLPLYPQDIQKEAAAYRLQQQQRRQQRQQSQAHSSSSSLLAFLSSAHHRKSNYNPSFSLFHPINFSTRPINSLQIPENSPFLSNSNPQLKPFHDNSNGGVTLPLSPVSPFSPLSSALFGQSIPSQFLPSSSFQFNIGSFDINPSMTVPISLIPRMNTELPSSQTPLSPTTPTSSATTGDYVIAASSDTDDYSVGPSLSRGNSGLLDDLLQEAKTLSRNENSRVASDKGKGVLGMATDPANQLNMSSSPQPSNEVKPKDASPEELHSMDDDLLSLLNFSSTASLPEWYDLSNEQEASPSPPSTATREQDQIQGQYYWNNLPTFAYQRRE